MATSINLELDDLMGPMSDLEDDLEADIPAVTRLPALDDDDDDDNGNILDTSAQSGGLLDTLLDTGEGGEGTAPAKKIVNRKPIPKLDATRLTSERGLPSLMKHFEKVTFKGKGHEVADLDKFMRIMEHWAHRLFPKLPFDDVIERIEKLGAKQPVKTCVKKIRLDMPLLDEDFVHRGGDDVVEEVIGGDGSGDNLADDFPAFPSTQPASSSNTPKVSMTDEQKARIERNKWLAMERRQSRQRESSSSQNQPASQADGLDKAELDAFFAADSTQKTTTRNDHIDSDEEEIEKEMWSQMMGGTREKKPGEEKRAKASQGVSPGKAEAGETEIDSDKAEMENEMWNQMTQPVVSQTGSKSHRDRSQPAASSVSMETGEGIQAEDDTGGEGDDGDDGKVEEKGRNQENEGLVESSQPVAGSQTGEVDKKAQKDSRRRKRVIDDDDEEEEEDDIESVNEIGTEVWNQMTEPVSSTQPAIDSDNDDMPTKSKGLKRSRRVIDDDDEDEEEEDNPVTIVTGVDIDNQMTEPVLSQSQRPRSEGDLSHKPVKRSRQIVSDDEDDEDDIKMGANVCDINTEPIPN